MKKATVILLLLLATIAQGNATYSASDKQQMQLLLQERKDRFEKYSNSLGEKTGFFGGKSKKDLQSSQKILVEIVRLDNQLISILNRQLDFKDFQKTEMTYQSLDESNKADQLSIQLQASKKEVFRLASQQQELKSAIQQSNLLLTFETLISLLSILIAIYFYKKSRRGQIAV